jgi:hypothetical protein
MIDVKVGRLYATISGVVVKISRMEEDQFESEPLFEGQVLGGALPANRFVYFQKNGKCLSENNLLEGLNQLGLQIIREIEP